MHHIEKYDSDFNIRYWLIYVFRYAFLETTTNFMFKFKWRKACRFLTQDIENRKLFSGLRYEILKQNTNERTHMCFTVYTRICAFWRRCCHRDPLAV